MKRIKSLLRRPSQHNHIITSPATQIFRPSNGPDMYRTRTTITRP
jgi:hypothetical protein